MHSYNSAYADKVISFLVDSGVSVVTNPPDNSVLQGSYNGYPRRRRHTRIDELREAGVTVGIGHDSVLDPGTTTVSRTRWTPRSFSSTTHTWRVAATFRRCGRC
jgi:hypothetical protein